MLQQRPLRQSVHAPPQCRASFAWHAPAQQTWPAVHAWPQVPQFISSVMRSVQELPQHEVGGACMVQSTAQPVHAGAVAT